MSEIIVPGQESTGPDFENNNELKQRAEELKKKLLDLKGKDEEVLTEEAKQARQGAETERLLGKDVDWSEYELPQEFAHLYPTAEYFVKEDGSGVWIAPMQEYKILSRGYSAHGFIDKGPDTGEPRGLAEAMTYYVNGPEGWKVAGILPNGIGIGVAILHRTVRASLPMPTPVEKETKVDKPTDDELKTTEERAAEWAGEPIAGATEGAEEALAALEGEDFGSVNAQQEEDNDRRE